MILGKDIYLRDVQETDLHTIMDWENNPENWEVSETMKEYSFQEIEALIASSTSYLETRQKRWMIVHSENKFPIGTIDIFGIGFSENEVGAGILIAQDLYRRQGYAEQAIHLLVEFCQKNYQIHTFHCDVQAKNKASLQLFNKCGFVADLPIEEYANFDSLFIVKMTLCIRK